MSASARRAFRRGFGWTWLAYCPTCPWEQPVNTRDQAEAHAVAHNDIHHAPTGAKR